MCLSEEQNSPEIYIVEISREGVEMLERKQDYFVHMLCHTGTASFRMDNKTYNMGKWDLAICLPNCIVKEFVGSFDFKATLLYISFDRMSKNNPDIGWGIKGFLFTKENPVVHLSESDAEKCLMNFKVLMDKYQELTHRFHMKIVDLQLQMFIWEMWNIFSVEIEKRSISTQQGSLFERFLHYVQQHCMEEREVNFYADKLFISPKYLTEVCKKNSGKTASEWIQNYTTQRLILLLENKNMSISEISDLLHFSSLSFFSRYVRKALGVSPVEYRQRIGKIA